jgi:hypothetical protein
MAQATSWDEATQSARVVLSTDAADLGDGYKLIHTRAAIEWPERPVPVVLDHRREIGAVIGAISDLALEPTNTGTALVGRLVLDGPAAGQALPLLRTGAARWSIGARILRSVREVGTEVVRATSWSIGHLALVVEPADPAAITRSSLAPNPMTSTIDNSNSTENLERSAKEIRRERDILKIAQAAGVSDEAQIDRWVASDLTTNEVSREAVRLLRLALEGGDVRTGEVPALGHPARMYATPANNRDLAGVIAAKMGVRGDGIQREWASMPMRSLLQETLANDPNCRGLDLAAMPTTKLVNRAFSTSDFTKALESSSERMLLSAYQEAQSGVTALAASRDLTDFRALELLRISQYGAIDAKGEGGEYKTSSFAEELAGTLQAAEYGSIQPLTRKALANDTLDIFGRLVAEMGAASARKERSELAARLLGISFTAANSTTAPASTAAGLITGIGNAALDLRRQTDANGVAVSFEPRLLLVPPELEASARQALGSYSPNTAGDVMAFSGLRLEVDHYLTAANVFYVADTAYPNLVIGRIAGGPLLSDSEDFKTGNRLYRVQSDFGTAVMDQRSICKVTI